MFGTNSSDGVQIAVDNGYINKVEPAYIETEIEAITSDVSILNMI